MKRFLPMISVLTMIIAVISVIELTHGQVRYAPQRYRTGRTQTTLPENRNGVPLWDVDPEFKNDVFTFVRIEYDSDRRPGSWLTDFPDADLNLSYRLQQLTSLK